MRQSTFIQIFIVLIVACSTVSCKKYLAAKTDKKLVVIANLQDLQSLLDNYTTVNYRDPYGAEASADNFYLTNSDYNLLTEEERNLYCWKAERVYTRLSANDWSYCYDNVYRANTVIGKLEELPEDPANQQQSDDLKGQAFFLRGKSFFKVAQIFTLTYDESSSATDYGIPLRLNTNFNETSRRSTLKQTYDQIIADLREAARLLQDAPIHIIRPGKAAAYGFLARVYLSMRKYDSCAKYADLSWQLKNTILTYQQVPSAAPYPFAPEMSQPELIYYSRFQSSNFLSPVRARIPDELYNSYHDNDLRKKIFFKNNTDGTHGYKGSYSGAETAFGGIATNEILLMRAECRARLGEKEDALADLNALMSKRWDPADWHPIEAIDAADVLQKVLQERRKELIFTGLRWLDIKRLNKEGADITLRRTINGADFTLPPNDLRYALAIPENVIALSGIPQNPR